MNGLHPFHLSRSQRFSFFTNPRHSSRTLVVGGLLGGALLFSAPSAQAQIVTDGTLGAAGALQGPNYQIPASLGQKIGSNLFHSFSDFQLFAGESATFSGPASIRNILSRVTGGNASIIDGQLNSTIPGANFFFINPAGTIFGPNAQINVGGSFVATSADLVKLGNSGSFNALDPSATILTSASPAAFGFLSPHPAAIEVYGSSLLSSPGQSISLIGGDIVAQGALIGAPSGQVNLISTGSAGEVKLDVNDATKPVDVSSFSTLGNIDLSDGTQVVADESGGIRMRAENLALRGANTLVTQVNEKATQSTGIDIDVRGDLTLPDGAQILSDTIGSGQGANITIKAKRVLALNGGIILAITGSAADGGFVGDPSRSGAAGSISVKADSIILDGHNSPLRTGIASQVGTNGVGDGGNIDIDTGVLRIVDGASIAAGTLSSGKGGTITIKADDILIDRKNAGEITGLSAQTNTDQKSGHGGDINIDTGKLTLIDGGEITASTFGNGDSGTISIKAGTLTIDTQGASGGNILTGITVTTAAASHAGQGGDIQIEAGDIDVRNGGLISANTFGSGNGGNVSLKANDITFQGENADGFSSVTAQSQATTHGGHGGNITIEADNLRLQGGGLIDVDTLGDGDGGNVLVKANSVVMDGENKQVNTGINVDSQAKTNGGHGGSIRIEAGTLKIAHGALIIASTFGNGDGGNIIIKADSLTIDAEGKTNLIANSAIASETGGSGRSGKIGLQVGDINIINGGKVSTNTFGTGAGGDIIVRANNIFIDGTTVPLGTGFTAGTANPVGGGNGGSINIRTDNLQIVNQGTIAASTIGSGQGGSITVNAKEVSLDNGDISADASGTGDAGSITVQSQGDIDLANNSTIVVTSAQSNGGDVALNAKGSIFVTNSSVDAQAAGDFQNDPTKGNGGSVQLNAGRYVLVQDSLLSAQAIGNGGNLSTQARYVILDRSNLLANAQFGNGGNILIRSKVYLPSNESRVDASSQFGLAGNVAIQSPNTNLGASLVVLPSSPLGAEAYLAERCVVRGSKESSSFTIEPQKGLPVQPGELLPSPAPVANPR